jgi:hypothetical protein
MSYTYMISALTTAFVNAHCCLSIPRVDSVAWNAHKMLGAPLQCALFLTKEKVSGTPATFSLNNICDIFINRWKCLAP